MSVFIIAEAGVNHNGELETAKKMVESAAKAGADAVKFQIFNADKIIIKKAPLARYQNQNIGQQKSPSMKCLKPLNLRTMILKFFQIVAGILILHSGQKVSR